MAISNSRPQLIEPVAASRTGVQTASSPKKKKTPFQIALEKRRAQNAAARARRTQSTPQTTPSANLATTPTIAPQKRPPSIPKPFTGVIEPKSSVQRSDDDILRSIAETNIRNQVGDALDAEQISFLARQQVQAMSRPEEDQTEQIKAAVNPFIEEMKTRQADLQRQIEEQRVGGLEERERQLQQFEENLRRQYEPQKQRAREEGRNLQSIQERIMGSGGRLTTQQGSERLQSIERGVNQTLASYDAAIQQKLDIERARLEGADAEQLEGMQQRLNALKDNQMQLEAELSNSLMDAKQSAMQSGDEARMQFIQNMLDQVTTKKVSSEFDKGLTQQMNDGFIYGMGSDGAPQRIKDAEGNFLTYQMETELNELDEMLSVSEAARLDLPFGTTRRQALGVSATKDDVTGMSSIVPGEVSPLTQSVLRDPGILKTLSSKLRDRITEEAAIAGYDLGALSGEASETRKQLQNSRQVLDLTKEILQNPALKAAVGPISRGLPSARTFFGEHTTGDFKRDVDRLKNLLTVENLDLMSGVLSETDIKILSSAATSLDRGMTESKFKKEVGRIQDAVNRSLFNQFNIPNKTFDQFKRENPENYGDLIRAYTEELEIQQKQPFNNPLSMGQKGSKLGALSEEFESKGDPGAIGYDKVGGYSFGKYQLAHNNPISFVTQSRFKDQFTNLDKNSKEFQNTWQRIAREYPEEFAAEQENYIKKTHYDPQVNKLAKSGIQVDRLPDVLKQVIWSTAVQHGPGTSIVANVLKRMSKSSLADQIKAIYEERKKHFGGSTPAVQKAVRNRLAREAQLALNNLV